jgi:hypothetical protein
MPCPDCIQLSSNKLIPLTPKETPSDSSPFPDQTEQDIPESALAYPSGGGSYESSSPIIAHDGTRIYMPRIPNSPSTDDDDDGRGCDDTLEPFAIFRNKVTSLIYYLGRGRTNSELIEDLGTRNHRIIGISYPENSPHSP